MRKKLIFVALLPLAVLLSQALWRSKKGETAGKIEVDGVTRKYVLYVPEIYDPGTPTPLVISIHGLLSWPQNQRYISRWNELADQKGFLVVYPAGTHFPRRWDTGGLVGAKSEPEHEVRFISKLIDKLSGDYSIDRQRIFANGMSNGGGMTNLLGCKLADRIAALGMVAGAYVEPQGGCHPARPVPVIAFHGSADPIVPYAGGIATKRLAPFPPITAWAEAWARRNGCDLEPEALPSHGKVSGIRYRGPSAGAEVILYTVEGGGHSWPGGGYLPKIIVGKTSMDIDATVEMWEFFTRHPLVEN